MERQEGSHEQGIKISERYPEALDKLIRIRVENVTEYNGGPLEVRGSINSWLSPIERVTDNGTQIFHLIYLNNSPYEFDPQAGVDVLSFDEMAMKLAGDNDPVLGMYQDIVDSNQPYVFLRPVNVGINHFPEMVIPDEVEPMDIYDGVNEVANKLGLPLRDIYDFRKVKSKLNYDLGPGIQALAESEYESPHGVIHVTDVTLPTDPWKFYQIISHTKLSEIDRESQIALRIDSGCDNGQIYLDQGCECREQMHQALGDGQAENGVVIHIPTQDGRGYGLVTKMETEGIKRGIPMTFNRDHPRPADTVESARMVLGDDFDLRTFDGAAQIVRALGFKNIALHTDNKRKFEAVQKLGIQLVRTETSVAESATYKTHTDAKKKYGDIYFRDGEVL